MNIFYKTMFDITGYKTVREFQKTLKIYRKADQQKSHGELKW